MASAEGLIRRLVSDVEVDSRTIQDFFVRMLRIKAVNSKMGGPGEAERAEFLESFLKVKGFR